MSLQGDAQRRAEPQSLLLVVSLQLGLLLVVFYYTFVGGQTALGVYDPVWRAATHWLTCILVAGWLAWRWLNLRRLFISPLDYPLFVVLLVGFLATLFSVNPFRSQEVIVFFATYLFFFFMAADLARRLWLAELVVGAILGTAGILWVLALMQITGWYAHQLAMPALLKSNSVGPSLASLPRLSVLGNPNTMAAYLVPIIPLTFHKLAIASRRLGRLLLAVWAVMLVGALILTQSRGGLVGLAGVVACYGVVLGRQKSPLQFNSKTLTIVGIGLAIIAIGYGGIILGGRSIGTQLGPIQVRIETMSGALKTLVAHPLLGSGPGTLGEELLRRQYPLREIHAHAHNLFLTFAAETGLLGVAALAWLVVVMLKGQPSIADRESDFHHHSLRLGLIAALVGFVVHNMVDSFFGFPAVMLLASVLFGLWAGLDWRHEPLSLRWAWMINLGGSAILVAVTVVGLRLTQGLKAYNQAVTASGDGNWQAVASQVQEAIELSPQSHFYRRQLGFAQGYLSIEDPDYRPQAIAQFQEEVQSTQHFALDHANLACLLWEDGQQDRAIREMTQASDIAVDDKGFYHLNLGRYLEAQGDYDQAWDEYARFLSLQPYYLALDYWQQESPRAERLPTIIERAADAIIQLEGPYSINLAGLYTHSGDFVKALRIFDQLQAEDGPRPDIHIGRAKVLWAMGEDDQALAELDRAIALNPRAALAYHYRGAIYLQQGHLDEATKNTEAALFLAPTSATYYQSGQIAQAQGDIHLALQHYETAIKKATPFFFTRYATEVAGRPPLAEERLPCLVVPRLADDLVLPSLAMGTLLENAGDYPQAVEVYQRGLSYLPDEPRLKARLDRLCGEQPASCQEWRFEPE